MTKRFTWTEEHRSRLKSLTDGGMSIRQTAQEMGLTFAQVANAKSQFGIKSPKIERPKKEPYSNLPDDIKQKIREMTESGKPAKEIAGVLRIKKSTVDNFRQAFGIKVRQAILRGSGQQKRNKFAVTRTQWQWLGIEASYKAALKTKELPGAEVIVWPPKIDLELSAARARYHMEHLPPRKAPAGDCGIVFVRPDLTLWEQFAKTGNCHFVCRVYSS